MRWFANLFGAAQECGKEQQCDPTVHFSDDEVDTAALRLLRGRYPQIPHFAVTGATIEKCDQAQKQVDALRAEFSTYEPARMRRAIMEWMDFFDNEISETREDVATQKSRREQEAYRASTKAHDDRVGALLTALSQKEKG